MPTKAKKEKLQFEISFYEGVLKNTPLFIEALIALGDLYTRVGSYEKGLEIDKKLSRLRSDDPIILYNLSCSYSLVNDVDRAYYFIKKAIKYGYCDFAHMERDHDLDNLRKDSRFRRYYSRLKNKNDPSKKNL